MIGIGTPSSQRRMGILSFLCVSAVNSSVGNSFLVAPSCNHQENAEEAPSRPLVFGIQRGIDPIASGSID